MVRGSRVVWPRVRSSNALGAVRGDRVGSRFMVAAASRPHDLLVELLDRVVVALRDGQRRGAAATATAPMRC
jgi:hypothetical protein